jgi:hypothetical protein
MKAKSISQALMEEMGYHEDEKVDEWTAFSPSSWFNNRDYGDDTSRDDARQQDADKAAQQALAAAAPRGGLDSEGDGKPEWAMNPGGVPAAGSTAPTPPVYTPGPVQQAVDAATTRAEIERAEAAAAAANNPNKPSAPASKIDWTGSEKGTSLAPGASEKAAAAGQTAAGVIPAADSNKPRTTPATTPSTTPAPSISTQPVNPSNRPPSLGNDTVDPKIAAKQKRMRDLIDQLKGKKSGPVDQRPVPSGNNNIIMNMQRELKDAGADLGTFGPNGDGIDGKMGGKTIAAMKKFPSIAANYANGKKAPFQQPNDDSYDRLEQLRNRRYDPLKGMKPQDDVTGVNDQVAKTQADQVRAEIERANAAARRPQSESIGLSEDDRILDRIRNVRF